MELRTGIISGHLLHNIHNDADARGTADRFDRYCGNWAQHYDCLAGICYIHQKNLVHADLKSSNILIDYTSLDAQLLSLWCSSCESVSCFECFQSLSGHPGNLFHEFATLVMQLCHVRRPWIWSSWSVRSTCIHLYLLYRTLHLIIPIEFPHRTSRRAPCVKDGGVSKGVSCAIVCRVFWRSDAIHRHTIAAAHHTGQLQRFSDPKRWARLQRPGAEFEFESDGIWWSKKLYETLTYFDILKPFRTLWFFASRVDGLLGTLSWAPCTYSGHLFLWSAWPQLTTAMLKL